MDTISRAGTTDGWAEGGPGTFTPPPPPEPPAPPVRPRHRAGPGRPRTSVIAAGAAVAIFAAGYLAGSAAGSGGSGPGSEPAQAPVAHAPTAGAWSFQPAAAAAVCAKDGSRKVFDALAIGTESPAPDRLSDYMLSSSPLAGYHPAYDGPVTLTRDPATTPHAIFARHGAGASYARSFSSSPSRSGVFSNYVFQFPDKRAAVTAATDAYVRLVCKEGADPMTVRHHPGIVVGVPVGDARDTMAWWIQGRRLLEVDYTMYGTRATDLANAAIVLRASWARVGGHPARDGSSS